MRGTPGLAGEQQREVLELVERQARGAADVARPRGRRHRGPQRLGGGGAGGRGADPVRRVASTAPSRSPVAGERASSCIRGTLLAGS